MIYYRMGLLLSKEDITSKIDETVSRSNVRLAEMKRDLHQEGCPGLAFAKLPSVKKYRKVSMGSDEYTLVDSFAATHGEMDNVCKQIRNSEIKQMELINRIVTALQYFRDALEWLIDGDYCATHESVVEDGSDKQWKIQRYQGDQISKFTEATCPGKYVPVMRMLKDKKVAGELAWDKVYRMTAKENARWRFMVDRTREDFTSGWRKLKRVLENLSTEDIKTVKELTEFSETIDVNIVFIANSFQHFMQQALEKDMIRPLSIDAVKRQKLTGIKERAQLATQKLEEKRAKKYWSGNTESLARYLWKNNGSALPGVLDRLHFK